MEDTHRLEDLRVNGMRLQHSLEETWQVER